MIFRGRPQRGFTLIEILIVGALLALFAGIAIFNVSEMYNNNVRKAAVGETKNLATACAMAQQDLGFIPKFNYLTTPKNMITTSGPDVHIRGDFDYIGFLNPTNPIWGAAVLPITNNFSARGYYAFSQSRGGLNRGKGGIVKVRLPSGAQNGAQDDLSDSLVDWPADPWGNPYVLYLLKTTESEDDGTPVDPSEPKARFIEEFKEAPDYLVAVVSYGPNGVPGAVWEKKFSGDPYGRGVGQPIRTATPEMRDARIYVDQDSIVPGGPAQFTMLRPVEFIYNAADQATVRRNTIVKGPDPTDAAGISTWNSVFPTTGLPQSGGGLEVRGVLDQGSDDIVYVF